MATKPPSADSQSNYLASERLDSWKEIAAYLRRDLRTVQRWEEREGLPVHRHLHGKQGSVYAFRKDIDAWLATRQPEAEPESKAAQPNSPAIPALVPAVRRPEAVRKRAVIYAVAAALTLALATGGALLWQRAPRRRLPVVHGAQTLAVLPFEDLSASHADGYIADGLTDDLITDFGQTGQLSVISRTSVMQFKDKNAPLRQIAETLDANLIVEGAILRSGGHVRITAQLIDASNDHHLWADRYEGDFRNVLTLQDDVAG